MVVLRVLASIRHYCLSLKDMASKQTAYHVNISDHVHTRLKQQLGKNLKIDFASLSKKDKEKGNYNNNCKSFAFHTNAIRPKWKRDCSKL